MYVFVQSMFPRYSYDSAIVLSCYQLAIYQLNYIIIGRLSQNRTKNGDLMHTPIPRWATLPPLVVRKTSKDNWMGVEMKRLYSHNSIFQQADYSVFDLIQSHQAHRSNYLSFDFPSEQGISLIWITKYLN